MLTKEWDAKVDLENQLSALSCRAWLLLIMQIIRSYFLRWCNTLQFSSERQITNWSLALQKRSRNYLKRTSFLMLIMYASISSTLTRSSERRKVYSWMRQNQTLNFKLNTSLIIFIYWQLLSLLMREVLVKPWSGQAWMKSLSFPKKFSFLKASFSTLGSTKIVESRCFANSSKSNYQRKEQHLVWYWEKSIRLISDFPGSDAWETYHKSQKCKFRFRSVVYLV